MKTESFERLCDVFTFKWPQLLQISSDFHVLHIVGKLRNYTFRIAQNAPGTTCVPSFHDLSHLMLSLCWCYNKERVFSSICLLQTVNDCLVYGSVIKHTSTVLSVTCNCPSVLEIIMLKPHSSFISPQIQLAMMMKSLTYHHIQSFHTASLYSSLSTFPEQWCFIEPVAVFPLPVATPP